MDHTISARASSAFEPSAGLSAKAHASIGLTVENYWRIECRDKDGNLKWVEEIPNLVTTAGKNDLLTKYLKGSAYTATWYVGLVTSTGFTAYAAADTMASHGGWTESTAYSNANRVTWTGGSAAAGSIDNSASQAVFNINGSDTIRGAFLVSDNTKAGSAGTLYGEADFAVARAVLSGDTLSVTITATIS